MGSARKSIAVHASAAHRVARARAWLAAREPAQELLIVAASVEAANELIRGAVPDGGAVFGWHRVTPMQLAFSLAGPALMETNRIAVGPLATEAVATRVVHELAHANALGRFRSVGTFPGFPRAVARALAELRLTRVDAGRLEPELAAVLDTYATRLAESGLTDRAGVLEQAIERLARAEPHPLLGRPTLVLDVPVHHRLEVELLDTLLSLAPEALITVPAGDRRSLAHFDAASDFCRADMHEALSSGSLENLQRHLFADTLPDPGGSAAEQVDVLSAPGENRECVEIARRAQRFARSGVRFDQMAVLLRSPEVYRAHLQEAFRRAGIPAHFARGVVHPDPAGRALLALLACAEERLSARRFAEYLSLGEVPDALPSGTPPPAPPSAERWTAPDDELWPRAFAEDFGGATRSPAPAALQAPEEAPVAAGTLRAPRHWEKLIVDASVIGGPERWERRLRGLENELKARLDELERDDEAALARTERSLRDLTSLREYALPLLSALQDLPAQASWEEWLERLSALATRALRHPERVLAVLAELVPMAAVGPVGLHEVRLVLSRRLLDLTEAPATNRYGRIWIAPIEAARGMCFDVVFVPGLAERLFPPKVSEEPILPDDVRRRVDSRLTTNEDRVERERLALHIAVGAADKRLVLSYPRLDLDQARPRVPSFYALEALRAAEGRLPDFDELASRAETASLARIGWPAPVDQDEAIDEAEHDLALLDSLLSQDPERSVGAARYLLSANPYLGRALRFRARRWLRRWTPADGLVEPSEGARAAIREHRLDARSYSPTALQNFAACPYKFFLYAVHRLAPREEAVALDELDPLSRGSMIHDVQFALFGRLAETDLLPVRPERLPQVYMVLDEVLDETAERYRDELAPAIDKVWADGIAAIRGDLREWLRLASEDESGFVPWRFELSFGLRRGHERDSHSIADPVELESGLLLRGAIDLVERDAHGRIRVTDHKTGKDVSRRHQVVAGGEALQPLLYALAAERMFPEDTVDSGRLFFCTARGGFAEHAVALNAYTRETARTLTEVIGEALERPFLPAAPERGKCRWCDYNVVCGPYEERRTQRKPKRDIEALLRLRSLQ